MRDRACLFCARRHSCAVIQRPRRRLADIWGGMITPAHRRSDAAICDGLLSLLARWNQRERIGR